MASARPDVVSASNVLARLRTLEWGLLLWLWGVLLAFWAQRTLVHDVERGRLLFLAAAGVAVVGMWVIEAIAPPPEPTVAVRQAEIDARARRVALAFLASGLIASVIAVELVKADSGLGSTAFFWLASMGLVLVSAGITTTGGRRPQLPRIDRSEAVGLAGLAGVVVLAAALRLPDLEGIPPDVHNDEAAVGLAARALLDDGFGDLFGLGWAGITQLGYAVSAVFMGLFGDDLYGLRLASVVQGLVSIVLLYLIVRRLFGVRPAVIAAFVLAVEQWHIHYSRLGIIYIGALPATLLAILFVVRAFDTGRAIDFALLGMSLAVCITAYYAAREIGAVVAFYALYRLARERTFLRRNLIGLAWAAVGFWVFLAPVLTNMHRESQPLLGNRASTVWLFAPDVLEHERQVYGTSSTARIVVEQATRTLEAVNRTGETSLQWGRSGQPLFDPWAAALVVPGLAFGLLRIRQPRYLLLVLWLAVPMVVTTLTVDAPFSPHLTVALPVLATLPALVVDAGWRAAARIFGWDAHIVVAALALVLGGLALHSNYHSYFEEHVKRVRIAGFPTLVGNYADQVNDQYRVLLVSGGNSLKFETARFLAPDLDGADLGAEPRLPLSRIPDRKGVVFVVEAGDADRTLPRLRRVYPRGTEARHLYANGVLAFVSYRVGHDEIERRAES